MPGQPGCAQFTQLPGGGQVPDPQLAMALPASSLQETQPLTHPRLKEECAWAGLEPPIG